LICSANGWMEIQGNKKVIYMIKIGLIGFAQGYYAVKYTSHLARLKGIRLTGVCDLGCDDSYTRECAFVSACDFANELKTRLYSDFHELLDQKPDAVIVANETHEHVKIVDAALSKGIHVFAAKPLTFKCEDVDYLRSKYNPLKQVLLCGNPLKYEKGLIDVKEQISQGKIGKIISMNLMINHEAMVNQEWERDVLRSGGPLGTYGVYLIDIIRWISGSDFKEIYAMGDNFVHKFIKTYDMVSVLARLHNGAICNLQLVSTISYEYPCVRLEVIGTEGSIAANYDNYDYLLKSNNAVQLGNLRYSEMGFDEIEHFIACIEKKETEKCSIDDMVYVTRGIAAIDESIRNRCIVSL